MYNMGRHGTLDTLPNVPFFTGKSKQVPGAAIDLNHSCNTTSSVMSPSKRVNLRSQSIKQLADGHALLERGGISKEQYDEIQVAILKDMKENMI